MSQYSIQLLIVYEDFSPITSDPVMIFNFFILIFQVLHLNTTLLPIIVIAKPMKLLRDVNKNSYFVLHYQVVLEYLLLHKKDELWFSLSVHGLLLFISTSKKVCLVISILPAVRSNFAGVETTLNHS